MEYGVMSGTMSVDKSVERAELLEDSGYARIWTPNQHEMLVDPISTLAVCAEKTESLELGVQVLNPITVHPTVIANQMATLNQLADGRITLGIGAGHNTLGSLDLDPARLRELHEAIDTIKALVNGEAVSFNGPSFELGIDSQPVDVLTGSTGPKSLRMSGEAADGVILGTGGTPEFLQDYALENLQTGLDRSGRSLDEFTVSMDLAACVADTKEEAREQIKYAAVSNSTIAFNATLEGIPESLRREVEEFMESEAGAQSPDRLSDELLDYIMERHAVAGTPEDCQHRLRELADVGVNEVALLFPSTNTNQHIKEFDERVIQKL
jgi:5,10-methylenetetrahydromethanopterin reductase